MWVRATRRSARQRAVTARVSQEQDAEVLRWYEQRQRAASSKVRRTEDEAAYALRVVRMQRAADGRPLLMNA